MERYGGEITQISSEKPFFFNPGYSSSDNTWEPETNLTNCQDTVRAFEAQQKKKPSPRVSRQRRSYPAEKAVAAKRSRSDVSPALENFKLEEILDVRREKKRQTIEYSVQAKKSNKSFWISSEELSNDHAQEIVRFLEEKYVD